MTHLRHDRWWTWCRRRDVAAADVVTLTMAVLLPLDERVNVCVSCVEAMRVEAGMLATIAQALRG